MSAKGPSLGRALSNVLDPTHRPALEATEHFMSWLRFGISAFAAALYLLPLNGSAPVRGPWHVLVAAAFLYSVPHVFIGAGRSTRRSRLRVLVTTAMDFVFVTAAVYVTGGENSEFIWLFPLTIVSNVLRYGDMAGALTVGGSMIAFGGIVLAQGADPRTLVPSLVARFGSFWVLYFMVAYLSRHASRMERVARQGTRLMEAVGRIGVPVNLAGNIMLALEAVCEEIRILFDVDHDRLAVNARHRSWVVGWEDQKLHVQTAERQTGLEARRQILTWLLDGIEDLGGRRIAFHLLTEAVEHLSPSAREVYRVLLSPGATEEAVRSV